MQRKLKSHKNGKLRGKQVSSVEPEHCFRSLDQGLQLLSLHIVQFSGEDEAGTSTELSILFVDHFAEDQLLEVNICLRIKISDTAVVIGGC